LFFKEYFLTLFKGIILGGEKMRKFSKGQSTLEYVIILAAVVGAIIAIAAVLKSKLTTSSTALTNTMGSKIEEVTF
jgi:uncharacterized protein (UPF0333 family)